MDKEIALATLIVCNNALITLVTNKKIVEILIITKLMKDAIAVLRQDLDATVIDEYTARMQKKL